MLSFFIDILSIYQKDNLLLYIFMIEIISVH